MSNLFLHYVFDKWTAKEFPNNPWCRYVDDGIIHCKSEKQGYYILRRLEQRFKDCSLEIHPTKTKIVYFKDSNRYEEHQNIEFTFLGYTFRPRKAKARNGCSFTSFLPAISKKSKLDIQKKVKEWRLLWQTNKELKDLAYKYNPVIRGWLNYYGKYGRIELARVLEGINKCLCLWVQRKYKNFKHKPFRARTYLKKMIKIDSTLFAHWEVGIT